MSVVFSACAEQTGSVSCVPAGYSYHASQIKPRAIIQRDATSYKHGTVLLQQSASPNDYSIDSYSWECPLWSDILFKLVKPIMLTEGGFDVPISTVKLYLIDLPANAFLPGATFFDLMEKPKPLHSEATKKWQKQWRVLSEVTKCQKR